MYPSKVWGVYHADGGLVGEVAYALGKIRGTASCALCDITHGRVTKKSGWKAFEDACGFEFELVHLNEQSPELAAVTEGATPCVVAETTDGMRVVLRSEDLEECAGSVECFREHLESALSRV
jgi:hypothetical protein